MPFDLPSIDADWSSAADIMHIPHFHTNFSLYDTNVSKMKLNNIYRLEKFYFQTKRDLKMYLILNSNFNGVLE